MVEGVVSFEDWQKFDFRVGKIVSVEDHPKADRLYVLRIELGVDIGDRTLVAGLKKYYKKEDLEGKFCIVFVNLVPATLRGVKSEGMVLAAVDKTNDKVFILQPEGDIALGSKVS